MTVTIHAMADSLALRIRQRLLPDAVDQGWVPIAMLGYLVFLFVPMLHANLELGALIGSCYLTLAYLSASPMFEALTERASRRFNYQYGSARAWGSFGYAVSALLAGFVFTINPSLLFWIGSAIAVVLLLLLLF